MITAAITAVIVWIAALFGISPGPWVAGVAVGVKITLVAVIALVGWRMMVRKRREAAAAEKPPEP
jgi:chromate transport protein ChrA